MTPNIVLILEIAVIAILCYQIFDMAKAWRARRRVIPSGLKEWKKLLGDAFTLAIGVIALMMLYRNYQQPMEQLSSIDEDGIYTITYLDTKTRQEKSLAEWKGKWLILNIWATWCPPCRKELPALEEVHEASNRTAVAVIALSDEAPEVVEKFLRDHPYSMGMGTFTRMPSSLASIGSRPVSLLISPEGRVADKIIGSRSAGFFLQWASDHGKK